MNKSFFYDGAVKFFGVFGLKVEKYVEYNKVRDFLELLRPVTTEFELMRVGGEEDGGYLIPDDLQGVVALFSPGVAKSATFELEIAERGIRSFLADFSVEESPCDHENIEFDKKYIGSKNNDQFITLTDWIQSKYIPEDADLLLQMDIEGSEYETILSTSAIVLRRFRILVIEFHYLDKVSTYFGNKMAIETLNKILLDFEIVHIHPNNCCPPFSIHGFKVHPCMEVTFLRRDRFVDSIPTSRFPHTLDRPNIKSKGDYSFNLY